ncbi:hypothetical protein Pmani_037977 [Petrolisthes manimaculis]|uniref:EGF-like domain-containing protein n=1 Tax=Petrolisthes manimaculis TaxID=1843537 RepID=A0AAE1NFR2_9EUCA|nr:hypothetical protein Pmani_037977 [Petrolisthes manimaculis]
MLDNRNLALVLGAAFQILVTQLQGIYGSRVGDRCENNRDCLDFYGETKCHSEGYCTCIHPELLYYTYMALAPRCDFVVLGEFERGKYCTHTSCGEDATCKANGLCKCNPGFIKMGDDCVRGVPVAPLDHCDDGGYELEEVGHVLYCDAMKNTYCMINRCLCTEGYYLNFNKGRCETVSSYLQRYGFSAYRGTFGMYCNSFELKCLRGLTCSHQTYKCGCPSGCSHVEETATCDCDYSAGPIVGACVGAIIVLIALACIIRCVIKRQGVNHSNQPVSSTNIGGVYHLTPTYYPQPTAPLAGSPQLPNTAPTPSSRTHSPMLSPSHTLVPQPYNPALTQSSNPYDVPPAYNSLFPSNSDSSQPAYNPSFPPQDTKPSAP